VLRALPWIAILVTIGVVQVIRDAPVDAVIFGTVAIALTLDAVGIFSAGRPIRAPLTVVLIGAAIAGVALVLAPRHSVLAGVIVVIVGVVAVVLAWSNGPARARDDRRILRGSILWATVTVALLLLEFVSFLTGRFDANAKLTHPAISDLLDPLVDSWPGKIAFLAVWLLGGVAFVRAGKRS
jgi:NADH:ubiquinone oxidoreductase subunit 6 (subunit J)